MRTMAPTHQELADHRGNPRPWFDMPLTYQQARRGMAFHEAGHAVLSMAYGIHIVSSEVISWTTETSWAITGNTRHEARNAAPWHYAAQCAAGELAHVQYLFTCGLWTPERAAACVADHDREQAIDVLTQFGHRLGRNHVPEGGKSWSMVQGIARRKLSLLWPEVCTTAHAMHQRDILTGDEIAALTGLDNPAFGET